MQFLIERARRLPQRRGYSPLILCGVQNFEFKYPHRLMQTLKIMSAFSGSRKAFDHGLNPIELHLAAHSRGSRVGDFPCEQLVAPVGY